MNCRDAEPRRVLAKLGCLIIILIFSQVAQSQHLADPEFKATVERPAYVKSAPRVLFDEAHFNHHTANNRYRPFAELLMNDGYRIVINRQPFTRKSLDSFKVLIVVNALGEDIDETEADKPAFTDEECVVLREWVKDGGSLLFIADAGPFAKSVAGLAKTLGIEMSGTVGLDVRKSAAIEYSRENTLLGDHSIMQGRDAEEKIQRVIVFEGQSIKGPVDSVVLFKGVEGAQGLAFKLGGGRVVALGDAEMLSALLSEPPDKEPIGMNYPEIDNKQLALNIMHWLSGLIK